VYTPLHGVGAETLIKVFSKAKFQTPILVNEQEAPDPDFPTTLFPNPEEPGVLDLAIKYAQENAADLIIANDPDADRCAVAINDINLGWKMLTGDQVGSIIGSYMISKNQSANAQVANSLVSSSLLSKIAAKHNLNHKETLTGFKWISKVENLIFGYEEALGYCIDPTNVNDKDGISAALIIAQIASDLKKQGITISDYLLQLGQEYGFHSTEQISIRYAKLDLIDQTLNKVASNPPKTLGEFELKSIEDLNNSKSMPTVGIRLNYGNNIRVIIRPSGTEPKLKCYIEVVSASQEESVLITSQIKQALTKVLS
jgi:phosphomannomutase